MVGNAEIYLLTIKNTLLRGAWANLLMLLIILSLLRHSFHLQDRI
jgi:hypothetical protein